MLSTIESLAENLQLAINCLNRAAQEISEIGFEPKKENFRNIALAVASIIEIQNNIYAANPTLKPKSQEPEEPDPELSREQLVLVAKLSKIQINEIDQAILSYANSNWRKVARIVGSVMLNSPVKVEGIPDIFYSARVRELVKKGYLEAQGNLQYMRYSEVRLAHQSIT